MKWIWVAYNFFHLNYVICRRLSITICQHFFLSMTFYVRWNIKLFSKEIFNLKSNKSIKNKNVLLNNKRMIDLRFQDFFPLTYLKLGMSYRRPGQCPARGPHLARQAPLCGPRTLFRFSVKIFSLLNYVNLYLF
jgi:hypothetical protein